MCIGSAAGDPGARVTVPINIDNGDGVAGFQIDFTYNPDWLTLVGVRLGADTAAAGSWSINHAPQGPGVIRILSLSGAAMGLNPGFKEIALVDFDVASPEAIVNVPFPLNGCVIGDELGLSLPCSLCVQPGVDAAYPRFATVLTDDGLSFTPAVVIIEPGDWVLWRNNGFMLSHSTTSGASCNPDGLWDGGLMPGVAFAFRFGVPPATYPYFCIPHCLSNHDGEIVVTDNIVLDVVESAGGLDLSWSGGSGTYRIFRSPNSLFVGTGQVEFVPDGGDTGTTLTDNPTVGVGEIVFYLVTNK